MACQAVFTWGIVPDLEWFERALDGAPFTAVWRGGDARAIRAAWSDAPRGASSYAVAWDATTVRAVVLALVQGETFVGTETASVIMTALGAEWV